MLSVDFRSPRVLFIHFSVMEKWTNLFIDRLSKIYNELVQAFSGLQLQRTRNCLFEAYRKNLLKICFFTQVLR